MFNEEMQQLIKEHYQQADDDGTLRKIADVCREFGQDPVSKRKPGYSSRYGPKYVWEQDDIAVYVDDYGHYMTVHQADRLVCSTHSTERFIILGDWIDAVLARYPTAEKSRDARRQAREAQERSQLLSQLA